jgi:hypothetical protein
VELVEIAMLTFTVTLFLLTKLTVPTIGPLVVWLKAIPCGIPPNNSNVPNLDPGILTLRILIVYLFEQTGVAL